MPEIIKITSRRPSNFTMAPNCVLRNKKLTLAAKGLYCLLASFSDGYDVDMGLLIKSSLNGRDAHYSAIKEIEAAGLLEVSQHRDETGILRGMKYVINLDPEMESENCKAAPLTEKPHTAKPHTGNQEAVLYKEEKNIEDRNNIDPPKRFQDSEDLFVGKYDSALKTKIEDVRLAWNRACEKSVISPGMVAANSVKSRSKREKAIVKCLKDSAFCAEYERVFLYCATIDFYCGKTTFRANLDWTLSRFDVMLERSKGFKQQKETEDDGRF